MNNTFISFLIKALTPMLTGGWFVGLLGFMAYQPS